MNEQNYDDIFKSLLTISGNELSRFEQFSLVIHSIFLKNGFNPNAEKTLDSNWNSEYNKSEFDYILGEYKIKVGLEKQKENDNILITFKILSERENTEIKSEINLNDDMCKSIDFENLSASIKEFESFIKENIIKHFYTFVDRQLIKYTLSTNNSNNFNVNKDRFINDPNYCEVNPNTYLNRSINSGLYNPPIHNPYFSTGGGSVGGNLVGPTSDIFTGHMFPQPLSGIHNPIKYDPIGPFGTFGVPNKKSEIKKTDPYSGGNPFDLGIPENSKKPFIGDRGDPFGGLGGNQFG